MAGLIYWRKYINDHARDTAHLSGLQDGMYNRMLDQYYAYARPLPLDPEQMFRMIRAISPEERKAVESILPQYFTREHDGWHQKRADQEIAIANKVIEVAKVNGRRGGRPRKTDTETRRLTRAKPAGLSTGSENETQTVTQTETREEPAQNHPPRVNHQESSFTLSSASCQPSPANPKPENLPSASRRAARNGEGLGVEAWKAYSDAYFERYKKRPLDNPHQRAEMKKFVKDVGVRDAPSIAAFFVRSCNAADFCKKRHPVWLLRANAPGIHTDWANGVAITDTEAREADRMSAAGSQIDRLLKRKAGLGS